MFFTATQIAIKYRTTARRLHKVFNWMEFKLNIKLRDNKQYSTSDANSLEKYSTYQFKYNSDSLKEIYKAVGIYLQQNPTAPITLPKTPDIEDTGWE